MSPSIHTACIKQFWTTLKINTVNDDVRLQALIDGKKDVITEASIRHDLMLNDAEELHTEEHVPMTSNDPLPSGEESMQLKELMVLCTNSSNKVLDLENEVIEMKSSHKAKIEKLESRVEKLEEENIDNLENVYNLDIAYEETVLSMQDVTDADGKEVEEMVEVITTAKIIVDEVSTAGGELNAGNEKPVSAAPTNITTAQPSEATKTTVNITTAPKAKGIVFHDMEDSTTRKTSSK
nr:hypothetical protein [Tanacetum cinerariifolium]